MREKKVKCIYCGKIFKGKGRAKYCSNSHKVLFLRKKNEFGQWEGIKEMLLLELPYLGNKSAGEIVKLVKYCLGKIKRGTR